MSIASRITTIEEHLNNVYNKLKDLGVDLSSTNKNINNISTILEDVWDEYPKVTATDVSNAVLENTKKGKMKLEVEGNDDQTQYEGYQLFNKDSITENKYLDTEGNIHDRTLSSLSDYIEVEENNNYLIDYVSITNYYKVICYYNSNKEFISSITETNSNKTTTFTTPSNCEFIRFHFPTENVDRVMLVKGTIERSYEPFVGRNTKS